MSSWVKILIGVALAASTLAVLIFGTRRFIEQRRFTEHMEQLREELYRARVSSDRCRNSLAASEASLQNLTATIDSLRSRVRSYETLGGGGVPANRYEEYLLIFNSYNDSVAAWEVRSQRLLTAEASCRDVIEEHNALSDSIQALLRGAGISE